jgi:hypothetical protein
MRSKRRIGVSATSGSRRSSLTGSSPPFERERFHDLDSNRSAELKCSRVSAGEFRIGPHQQALCSGPDAPKNIEPAIFAHQVCVPIAGEASRAGAERHKPTVAMVCPRYFRYANVGLVIRHPHVLGPELGRHFDWQACAKREIDHLLIDSFGMEVQLDSAATSLHAIEYPAPERIAASGNATFPMNAQSDSADCWTGTQQRGERIAAVGEMIACVESLDRVVCLRTVFPLVAMRPKP